MKTDENKPSPGAITTAGAIQAAQDSKGLPTEDWARIIDAHTNAIADELAKCLEPVLHGTYFISITQVDEARNAFARYNAAKAKEEK